MAANQFNLARLRAGIKPFRLHWFPSLRSTNDHAAVLRERGELYAPAIVLTGHQTAGRGRGEHTWWSSRGCITVTFVFPIDPHLAPNHIPLLAGLAVRNASAEITGISTVQLKWPNDILHQGRKLAGLLCERIFKADLIGIGLNVNLPAAELPAELKSRTTSLSVIRAESAAEPRPDGFDMTDALITLSGHLHRAITHHAERSFADMLKEYDAHHALKGRKISVTSMPAAPAVAGRCEGLDDMGRLLIRTRSGLEHVIAGHVQMTG